MFSMQTKPLKSITLEGIGAALDLPKVIKSIKSLDPLHKHFMFKITKEIICTSVKE